MTPVERLLERLPDAKQAGMGWSARCPAHEDRRASLSIAEGDDGRALIKCHAGCTADEVCAVVGLRVADLMPTAGKLPVPGNPRIVAQYNYRDEAGNVLFQVVRLAPKDFRQRRPRTGGGWDWTVKGVRVVPYRLLDLLGNPDAVAFVVEGEKDCDALSRLGLVATCNAGGATKWTSEHSQFLHGRLVVIAPDNDLLGRNHAQFVAQSLHGIAESVRIVELPGLPAKGDVSDWIAAGGTLEQLERLAEAAPIWTPTAQLWPEKTAFGVLDLPKFPTHALPDPLREWVETESRATQTPADLAGLLALAVCSACIARCVVVEARPGWTEPTNVFVAVLLESGNRKSKVFADATKPLRELETELIEAARPTVARAQSSRRQDDARLRKLEKLAAEKHGDEAAEARHQAGNLAAEMVEHAEPALPRLIVDDATPESLGMMLDEQGGRIASMSPEGGVFDLMAGLYSNNGIPQFGVYLMGHSGDDLTTDRVSRKSVCVKQPALTCAYAIQPAVVEKVARNHAFRDRGLLARFMYAAPESWIGRREIAPAPVSDFTREAYRKVVRALAEVKGHYVLQLSPEAADLLYAWETEIEAMLGDGGQMETIRDWGAKLAGATLRLSAVLHCVEHGTAGQIEKTTIAPAIEIARFLVPHAEAVLNAMLANEDKASNDARYVLRWIERHGRRNFTKSEAQHHGKRRFPRADDIDPALSELTRRGYIRPKPAESTGSGRPPSPAYEVNPSTFVGAKPEKRSQYSYNVEDEPARGNSGNNGSAFEPADSANRMSVTI